MRFLLLLVIVAQTLTATPTPSQKTRRLALQKRTIILKAPRSYANRILRLDSRTGNPVEYDPRPRVVLLDVKSGKYAFKWIGYDGNEKTVIYQRPDAFDATVSGSVSKTPSGTYLYTYAIQNLASSGQNLSGFAVQHFASDVKPQSIGNGYVGEMSKNREMKEGNWIYFGTSNFKDAVTPGRNIELALESLAPPGLVECRAHGGVMMMIGVDEDMPQELENVLPGYEAWPRGYTIGPVENLKALSPAERANYLLKLLPKFNELGWMTADALHWYQQNLNRIDLGTISKRAGQDLGAGNITNEVLVMIQGIR
jgi:hypothetical protein